jgi:hypothetical protein
MKGKHHRARLTSVPRVLTIAVEREPKGDDDISISVVHAGTRQIRAGSSSYP